LIVERSLENPREKFLMAVFQRFLDRILGIYLHETVMLVPARRLVLQRADVIQPAKIAWDDGQRA
jgi:hypothetical protein